jgi:flagellar biosynthetic protein FliP
MGMTVEMRRKRIFFLLVIAVLPILLLAASAFAATPAPAPNISISGNGLNIGSSQNPKDVAASIQILLGLTILSIAPSILIMMTSFTRIIIILSFLRNALGTQQMPPNQVLIGLALFLTLFIMAPVATKINDEAFQPYTNGKITQKVALDRATIEIKAFMLAQFKSGDEKDLKLFTDLAKIKQPVKPMDLPLYVVIPAFMIHELTIAFQIGFLIFIPFLVIDMIVSSTLMSMGMMMLPPVMISLPFKILLFMMVDGWTLIAKTIVNTFRVFG